MLRTPIEGETPAQIKAAIRRLEAENARLRRMARTDALTGIGNRSAFRARLNEAIRDVRKNRDTLSLMYLDVDEFFAINDRFGHAAGDRVLRMVARILRDAIRESDFLARYSGDEFVVLLPATSRSVARIVAERARAAIEAAAWPNAPVTVSIGVGSVAFNSVNARSLLREADRELFRAKAAGRNRVGGARTTSPTVKYRPTVKTRVQGAVSRTTVAADQSRVEAVA